MLIIIAEFLAVTDGTSELVAGVLGGVTGGGLGYTVVKWLMGKHDRDMQEVKHHLANVTDSVTALMLGLKAFENSPHIQEVAKKIIAEEEILKRKSTEKG